MYNAMNTDLMFQEVHDRAEAMRAAHVVSNFRETRRWWRRSSHRIAG